MSDTSADALEGRFVDPAKPSENTINSQHSDESKGTSASFLEVLGFVLSYWRRRPRQVSLVFLLMALATIADALLPAAAGKIVDVLALGPDAPGAADNAQSAVYVFVFLAIGFYALRLLSIAVWNPFAAHNMEELVSEAFAKAQSFSSDWHANNFAGATVRKISRGMWAYDMMSDILLIGIFPPAMIILAVTFQMALRWPLVGGFIFVAAIIFTVSSAVLALRYVAPANRVSNDADSEIGAALADAISCNAIVKSFGAEDREESRFRTVARSWRKSAVVAWGRFVTMWAVQFALLFLMQTGMVVLSVWQWSNGAASAGDVAFVLTSFFVMSGYLRILGDSLQQLQRSVNEMDDVVGFAQVAPEVRDLESAVSFAPKRGEIVFDDVTFRYRNQSEATYEDFSLLIKAGERVALVGPSGSGKSTFVRLVQRLYDVSSGAIRIDGQDVRNVVQTSLRRAISVVPQDPALFHRTLAENIAYGRPNASRAEIEIAAERARASEFIAALPEGLDTLVGERGVKLSGGERQRVALARAFLMDAPILVLDEATSSLDSETEAQIQAAMDELTEGRTSIIIAHRLSTIRNADRILVFDRGRIVEDGRHEDLLAREDGHYRRLHTIQMGGS